MVSVYCCIFDTPSGSGSQVHCAKSQYSRARERIFHKEKLVVPDVGAEDSRFPNLIL